MRVRSLPFVVIAVFICQVEAEVNVVQLLDSLQKTLDARHKCNTTWMGKYAQRHKELLGLEKRLVHVPFLSGLADRIIGLVTTTTFAFFTDRAVQSGRRPPLLPLETFFTSPYINWTRAYDPDWLLVPLHEKANPKQYNDTIVKSGEFNAVNTHNNWKLLDAFLRQDIDKIFGAPQQFKNVMLLMNRGKTIRLFENSHYAQRLTEEMRLTPETAFGCMVSFLLQPRPEVFASGGGLAQILEKLTVPSPEQDQDVLKIAIQIRAGDANLLANKDTADGAHFQAYFKCAQEIEEWAKKSPSQRVLWYLTTDSRRIREYAVARFGAEKVLTSLSTTIEHSSKEASTGCSNNCTVSNTGFMHAAAEWWMIGACHYHVITLNSGYGRSAAARSLRRNSIYTVREDRKHPMKVCNNTTYTDLEQLSYDWSGL